MRTLHGKRVLVTGAASGIGRALSERFAAEGARLILTDLDEPRLRQAADEMRAAGHEVHAHRLDVTDRQDVLALRATVHAELGPIDVLVNNAGIVFGGPFLDVPLDKHLTTYRVNILGPVILTHAFLPDLVSRPDAHIVNIASIAGYVGVPYGSTYASSKWALIGFSESVEEELRKEGHPHVHVTTVCPSLVSTGLFAGARPARLTQWLTAEQVADRVAVGVLRNRSSVRVPWLSEVAPLMRGILPHRAYSKVLDLFGASTSMSHWTGRSEGAQVPEGAPVPTGRHGATGAQAQSPTSV